MLVVITEPDQHAPLALEQSAKDGRLNAQGFSTSKRCLDLLAGLDFHSHIRCLGSVIDGQPDLVAHAERLPSDVVEGGNNVFRAGWNFVLGVLGRTTWLLQVMFVKDRQSPRVVKNDLGLLASAALADFLR